MRSRTQRARNDLLGRFSESGSWKSIEEEIGIDRSYIRRVANGVRPASKRLLKALGLIPKPKPRKNWRRKRDLLSRYILKRWKNESLANEPPEPVRIDTAGTQSIDLPNIEDVP